MPSLSFVARVTAPGAADRSHISDLALITLAGQTRLYATTQFDGQITSWDIDGARPQLLDALDYSAGLAPGRSASLMTINAGSLPLLLAGGGTGDRLATHVLTPGGDIAPGLALPNTGGVLASLSDAITLQLGSQQFTYGGLAGGSGLGRLRFDAAGVLTGRAVTNDTAATYADQVSDTAHLMRNGTHYIFSASATEHGVTAWQVTGNGGLAAGASMGAAEGLWIAAPTALATAEVGGQAYLIVASATSNSLSVMRVGTDGSLTVTDHMLDTRDTRFGGAQDVEAVTVNGRVYLISGGADDGINVHLLLSGGQLVHLDSFADTSQTGLQNISAITAQADGNGIDIFAASASETGITTLRFDTGGGGLTLRAAAGGDTLTGGNGVDILTGRAGDDRLSGGGGTDILRDGAGVDTLAGGAGADIFILSFDGSRDVITDFTPGEDRLDLSGWPMVRAASQLTMVATPTGLRITYGTEELIVHSADGQPIDHRLLTDADLIGGARLPQVVLPGFPGPYAPPPDLPGQGGDSTLQGYPFGAAPTVTIGGQTFRNPQIGTPQRRLEGSRDDDVIFGGRGRDRVDAGRGDDRISGGAGSDRIFGGTGADTLRGRDGDDDLIGGDGRDRIYGDRQEDLLRGYRGDDVLFGGRADDVLMGGDGRDLLYGGKHNDRLIGNADRDQLFGGTGADRLSGGRGDDQLWGGAGRDRLLGETGNDGLYGGIGNDRLEGGDGRDRLSGMDDRDVLFGGRGNDRLYGGDGVDSVLGNTGQDQLFGGAGNDYLSGGDGSDRISGGAGYDRVIGGTGHDGLNGNRMADLIFGEAGNDTLYGGHGRDDLRGGTGADRLNGGTGADVLRGGTGADVLRGEDGDDQLAGGAGGDLLGAQAGDDTLFGGSGNDTLLGYTGADDLHGGADMDQLYGGRGADTLAGGAGNDQLWGGEDADVFLFSEGADLIVDFDQASDWIIVDFDAFPGTLTGPELLIFYGSITHDTVTLDFENGNVLTIANVSDYATLGDALSVL